MIILGPEILFKFLFLWDILNLVFAVFFSRNSVFSVFRCFRCFRCFGVSVFSADPVGLVAAPTAWRARWSRPGSRQPWGSWWGEGVAATPGSSWPTCSRPTLRRPPSTASRREPVEGTSVAPWWRDLLLLGFSSHSTGFIWLELAKWNLESWSHTSLIRF